MDGDAAIATSRDGHRQRDQLASLAIEYTALAAGGRQLLITLEGIRAQGAQLHDAAHQLFAVLIPVLHLDSPV
ncbi:hypothetical protein D3C77_418480 [compost metagenome]